MLKAIYDAIINNRNEAEKQLSDELKAKLGHLSFLREYEYGINLNFGDVSDEYEACKKILKFRNQIKVYRS